MIRPVKISDTEEITNIYNDYIVNSVVTFETEPLGEEEMRCRIAQVSIRFPYFVLVEDGKIVGYCYAHPWKSRAAYKYTLETTVYVSSKHLGRGIGKQLMLKLIEECRRKGYRALVACITSGNTASCVLHEKLGYKKVSHFERVGIKLGKWLDVVDYELLLTPYRS